MKILHFKKKTTKIEIVLFGKVFSIRSCSYKKIRQKQAETFSRIQKKFGKEKIRVGFLINDLAKWQYQSFYDELEKCEYFEPIILVTKLLTHHKKKKNFYKDIDDVYDFFKSKNYRVLLAYDKGEYLPIKDLDVDIVFYQQPWELADIQRPDKISETSLPCYVSYGLNLVDYYGIYMDDFHNLMWLMFVENDIVINKIRKTYKVSAHNCVASGYTKLDAYFDSNIDKNKKKGKPIIIYAPHHSFEKGSLACATFETTGFTVLDLAKKYKDKIDWVFKPHPRFKSALVLNNIMTEQEVDNYYEQWRDIGLIYEGGNYIKLFQESDAMITDCCSFLGEYLPSKQPLFHLLSDNRPFNELANMFIHTYYQIEKNDSLEDIFRKVIIEKNDYKKNERCSKIEVLFDEKCTSALKMLKIIINKFQDN